MLFNGKQFAFVALIAILCLELLTSLLQAQSPLEPDHVNLKWKELEKHPTVGQWTSRSENPGSAHIPASRTEEEVMVADEMYLVTVIDLSNNESNVNGFNDSYRFELRGKGRENFVLRSIDPLSNRTADVAKSDERSLEFGKRNKALNFLFGMPWPYFADCPGFKLQILGETTVLGRKAIEFGFECTPPPEEHLPPKTAARNRPVPLVRNGRGIMLDETCSFVPVRYSFEAKYQPDEGFTLLEIENEFDFALDKVPVVTKRIERRVFKGETDVTTRVHEYQFLGKSPPESDFRLPAFGLPEPEFAMKSSRTPIILVGLAVVGLVSFVVGRRLRTARPGKGGRLR
jgi:hypothetical protein